MTEHSLIERLFPTKTYPQAYAHLWIILQPIELAKKLNQF